MGGTCSMEQRSNSHKILIGKPYWKETLGRPRRRWEIVLKWISGIWSVITRSEFVPFMIETNSGLL
jgi:hypothetical protein